MTKQIFGFEGPVKFTPTSAEFSKDATFEEIEEVAKIVAGWRKASPFHIGDILNKVEAKWGEKYAQLSAYFDLSPDTLMNYKWVMKQISYRCEILNYHYHYEVAKLEPKQQKRWLDLAATKGWTLQELKDQLTAEGLRKTVKHEEQNDEKVWSRDMIVIDEDYLNFIRSKPCLIGIGCIGSLDPDHLQAQGTEQHKRNDHTALPLCRKHHSARGQIGNEKFEKKYGVNLYKEALFLVIEYFRAKMIAQGEVNHGKR